METLKFVMVGHIDHGKSTLIGRLLYDTDSLPKDKIDEIKQICDALGKDMEFGYVMDHLEEERDQGITIETTQTFFKTKLRDYVIIDAPGHVEFLRNMITGASQAEAAILIVDAEEGVREQTKRHAYILSLLGLGQVIVVINKMDLVDYDKTRFDEVKNDIINFLKNIDICPSYIIPISAKYGDNVAKRTDNLSWFEGHTILEALDTFKTLKGPIDKPLRFVVQDVYNFEKRISVGRVESGLLATGDKVLIMPSGESTTIKSLEDFERDTQEAEPGKSIGITTTDKVFIDRGNVIVHEGEMPIITDSIRANIFWMDKKSYKLGDNLYFRCTTQEVNCSIEKIYKIMDSSTLAISSEASDTIRNRDVAEVRIRTGKPIVIEDFYNIRELGRFVLGADDTLAGGIIMGDDR